MELYFPVILDGATGTQLQRKGMPRGCCSEKWVMENPQAIIDIQKDYISAGSQIVYACTFGANRVKLEENGLFNQVVTYNKQLVSFSREAVGEHGYVAGDMAPTGKFLAPMGDVSFEELVDIYTEQAKALEEAGVDLFVIETMMTIPEARAAVLAVKSVSSKPVYVSFTCDEKGKTLTGTDITAALIIMQGMGVDAFGLNCSVGPADMLSQLQRLSAYNEVPLIAKPNAGLPELIDGKTVYNCPPEDFSAYVKAFAQAGVSIFGGCCGTQAEHIQAIHDALDGFIMTAPAPKNTDRLPLATEKNVFLMPTDTQPGRILKCDDSLAEGLEEAAENPSQLITIRIGQASELDDFADNQPSITNPLCISCDDAALLEEALRLYQGRAMYDGRLSEEVLLPLARKYGLVF